MLNWLGQQLLALVVICVRVYVHLRTYPRALCWWWFWRDNETEARRMVGGLGRATGALAAVRK